MNLRKRLLMFISCTIIFFSQVFVTEAITKTEQSYDYGKRVVISTINSSIHQPIIQLGPNPNPDID